MKTMQPTTSAPTTCPHCGASRNSDDFVFFGSSWIDTGDCQVCIQRDLEAKAKELRGEALSIYRSNNRNAVPKKYKLPADGGSVDLEHEGWVANKGRALLFHLKQHNPESHIWAGIVGPGGTCKSTALGLHCKSLADRGKRVMWCMG